MWSNYIRTQCLWANIERGKIWESEKQKLLGIVIDRNLCFDEYILSQRKKAVRKLSVFARTWKFMAIEHRSFMKKFIESQFDYCSLVLMCCNRSCNNCINHLHKRALRIVYNDNVSSFEDLLQRNQSVSARHKNICLLGIELYKARSDVSSLTMNELTEQRNILYNLQSTILDLKFGTLYQLIWETLETLKNLRGELSVGLLKTVFVSYVLITSIAFGMSSSYIFGTSHSEVLWQIEIVLTESKKFLKMKLSDQLAIQNENLANCAKKNS